MIRFKPLLGLDYILFACTLALMVIGILFIYSSGVSSAGVNYSTEYIRQIIWASVGLLIMIIFTYFDYNQLRGLSLYLYLGVILLLILTLFLGQEHNGAKSWLAWGRVGFQPSEFAKLSTGLFLGLYLENTRKDSASLKRFLTALGIMLVPFGLIFIQPDLGTSMVFLPMFIIITFIAGVKIRYLFFLVACSFLSVVIGMLPAWEEFIAGHKVEALQFLISPAYVKVVLLSASLIFLISLTGFFLIKKKYYYWISYCVSILFSGLLGGMAVRNILKVYQIKRLIVFIDPSIDPRGAGWNVIQSVTAVGSGGLWGKGFLKGTQSHFRFLPQQSTDFIFSIIAEEWGFMGCLLVFALFMIILIRSFWILLKTRDAFALYSGSACLGMIFVHFIINIGMAMGIMPITGIPLFFLSYGGSALWTGVLGVSLLMNINKNRHPY
ncbi:MAG: rod shape-determining protein RodA [Spirochaetales bacterium]|jgi:rod shape determining protein RodA|nr:rod shape-determining protein RodA [Spirochaetales bacterium]